MCSTSEAVKLGVEELLIKLLDKSCKLIVPVDFTETVDGVVTTKKLGDLIGQGSARVMVLVVVSVFYCLSS